MKRVHQLTPKNMIEDLARQVIESRLTLEMVQNDYSNISNEFLISCLIRSLDKTADIANGYIDHLSDNQKKDNLTIGDRIREMRKLRDLNHTQLAIGVGVTRSCIIAWEENVTVPASDKIIPLSEALNCDPLWLLTGKGANDE